MKFGNQEKQLLIGLLGILIAAAAWIFVASPLKDKTEMLQAENEGLKVTKDEYEAIAAQKPIWVQKGFDYAAEREQLLGLYPSGMSREDEIMYWAKMENSNASQLSLKNIVMSEWQEVFAEGAEAVNADEEGATQLRLYKAPVNYAFVSTYDGLKGMCKYVFAQNDKKSIEGLSASFDTSTGNLVGYLDMNMYYMIGTGKEYKPTSIPAVPTGVSDVFQTVGDKVVKIGTSPFAEGEDGEATEEEATED